MALRTTRHAELKRRDRARVGRTEPAEDLEIVAASGSRVRDARGRTFIDFQMGWGVGALGWNPRAIVDRVRAYDGPTYVNPGGLHRPWVELAEQLVDLAPGRLARAFRCVGGTEAVELALQLAMAHTGRHKLVSVAGAYHGNSFGARTVGEPHPQAHLAGAKKLALPLDAGALGRLEKLLERRDVAAVILEPVITNLEVVIPDPAFLRGLAPLCHRHGTLVIADEVVTALGRTGAMFASELHHLQPDLLCIGKPLGSGVVPIATTLATADIAASAAAEMSFYSTFGWHPLGVTAALATLAYWRDHRALLLDNVAAQSAAIRDRLRRMPFRGEAELRVQGLAIAVALDDADDVARIGAACRRDGLLLYADEALVMFPPLDVDEATVGEALDILERCVRRT